MSTQNRWHKAKFEATGGSCSIVAVYPSTAIDDADGSLPPPSQIALSDGIPLVRIAKGRYQTRNGVIVVSLETDAP